MSLLPAASSMMQLCRGSHHESEALRRKRDRAVRLRHCRDVTSMMGAPTTMVFPQRDDDGNLLETQYGRSRFRDQQVRLSSLCQRDTAYQEAHVRACMSEAKAVLSFRLVISACCVVLYST